MTAAGAAHLCIDCKKDPPRTVRPVDQSIKPWRCHSHKREFKLHRRRVVQNATIRRVYGIEPAEYWAVYDAQGQKCAIRTCSAVGKVKLLAVDHDHELAALVCDHDPKTRGCRKCIRGLLCGPHNYELIGKYRNSLQDALNYLASPPARPVLEARWAAEEELDHVR